MYRELNDYEILYLVKENDDINYEIIYEKYTPLIYKFACKYEKICKKFGYEFDDIMQIGYISLFRAIDNYRYDSNMFYTFVIHIIENSIISEIRKNNTLKSKTLNESVSYDILVPNTQYSYIDIIADPKTHNDILDSLDIEYRWIVFKNTLPFDIACIFELRFNGCSKNEISMLLDMDISDINKGIKEIKKQLLYI